MIQVGPQPQQPLPAGSAARPPAGAVPVQLAQGATLPESLPANAVLTGTVQPGTASALPGEPVVINTTQGPVTMMSPVPLAAGSSVSLQLASISGRTQLF